MLSTPLIWPLLASILISSWLVWHVRQKKDIPAAKPFTMIMAIGALVALTYAIEISLSSPDLKIFFSRLRLVFQPFVAPAVALLVIEYLGWLNWITRPRLVLIFAIPLITALLSLSGAYHDLFRYDFRVDASGPVSVVLFERGPWWWVYYPYSMMMFLGSFALLLASFRIRALRYRNSLILVSGILLLVIVDVLFVLKLTPIPGYYWTPSFIVVSGSLFAWGILRGGLFETSAVARNVVWEHMQDLALMLDSQNRLIDFNRSAQAVIGLTPASIGLDLSALPEVWSEVLQRCVGRNECREEVRLGSGPGQHVYEMSITVVRDWRQRVVGRMFLFHDLSERTRIKDALAESAALLRATGKMARVGGWSVDLETNRLTWTETVYDIHQVDRDYQPNVTEGIQFYAPEHRPLIENALQKAIQFGEPFDLELQLITARGRRIWVHVLGQAVVENGKATRLIGTFQDIDERMRDKQAVMQALEEKELLLKEIHHRVKNNLTVVSSLLDLQAMASQDEQLRTAFQDSQQRIQAMIGIHQQLYQSKNMAQIDMADYIRNLTDEMQRVYASAHISLDVDVRDIHLVINQAIPVGLIINELVTNAFKYGFTPRLNHADPVSSPVIEGQSTILVAMHPTTGAAGEYRVVLRVENNGQIFPSDVDIQSTKSLGLRLVRQLTSQIHGSLQLQTSPQATAFIIEFPLDPPE